MKIINCYHSTSGNTDKVAEKISTAIKDSGHDVHTIKVKPDGNGINVLDYDMVFVGSGVYGWLPGKPMMDFLALHAKKSMTEFGGSGEIAPNAPRKGRYAVIYCTYGGSHTGFNEAVPTLKYMGQLFDHLGYDILCEWGFIGAYRMAKLKHHNTQGRLGNIEDRPNESDLNEVYEKTLGLLAGLGGFK